MVNAGPVPTAHWVQVTQNPVLKGCIVENGVLANQTETVMQVGSHPSTDIQPWQGDLVVCWELIKRQLSQDFV